MTDPDYEINFFDLLMEEEASYENEEVEGDEDWHDEEAEEDFGEYHEPDFPEYDQPESDLWNEY